MKLKTLFFTLASVAAVACTEKAAELPDLTQYVNTKIGTGGHGHVFVGANVPFGAVQLGPTSIPQAWDWCSGYHDSDCTVIGFSHTHLEGTGIGDLFDVTVMPVTGEVNYARGTEDDPASGLWSYADRSREVTRPGYYKVPLTRYEITAELTATARVGMHRYTFPATESGALVIDLENGGCWDKATKTGFEISEDGQAVGGWRYSAGWAKDQKIFFYAEFDKPVEIQEINDLYARVNVKGMENGGQVMMKVAISPVSIEGAKANMAAELPGWDFEAVAHEANARWNKELNRIRIETADADKRTVFYTALYHYMIHPALFCDVDGSYRGSDGEVRGNEGFVNYSIFSLWDTYRAALPLTTILFPDMENDFVNTWLKIYQQQGKLPVWHLMGNETDCMVGNPGIIPVADAIVKGYNGFDKELAFEAMKNSAMLDDRGQDLRKQYGYIPSDLLVESIAQDMEYAIADGALANAAEALGKAEDAAFFRGRSHSYRVYMDPETMNARGRFADMSWRTPFNPYQAEHRANDYCEGNAWQYTWLMPQDFEWLANEFYGSEEDLVNALDLLFSLEEKIEGADASPDISGLIGQYAHGNEPSHHIIYFYTMAGAPAKAAEKVQKVYKDFYFNDPNGLAGNEDEGQMSAWYIMSSLGFYQPEPASTRFWFGSPNFEKASVKVAGGTFDITAKNLSDKNIYIQSVTLNGKPLAQGYLEFQDIYRGGDLVYEMGPEPALWY